MDLILQTKNEKAIAAAFYKYFTLKKCSPDILVFCPSFLSNFVAFCAVSMQ